MQIIYSPQFVKDYKKMAEQTKRKAESKENIFRNNPFDNRLKTHKLSGKFHDLWSFSVDYNCRIIFKFKSEKAIIFHAIGGYSIYGREI
ncbi:MAG: type II toxin-antitoxin system mRNA interferase toxin, RelE/StbE family [Patescibacteria group bacterium]